MPSGQQSIPRVQVGGVSLVSAEYANQIIDRLNAIQQARIAPIANVGSFMFAGDSFILDLSALDSRLSRIERVNAVYNTLGGVAPFTVANANVANVTQVNGALVLDFTKIHARVNTIEHASAIINTGGGPVAASNIAVFEVERFSNFFLNFTALHNRLANIEANLANVNVATVSVINTRLTNLIASINNANISANCNANTNAITVTLTFPNVPGV